MIAVINNLVTIFAPGPLNVGKYQNIYHAWSTRELYFVAMGQQTEVCREGGDESYWVMSMATHGLDS